MKGDSPPCGSKKLSVRIRSECSQNQLSDLDKLYDIMG